jgi:SAM-dependent methyltransferase
MRALLNHSDAQLLDLAQTIYDIPSLAAWRAAELKTLRHCTFAPPVLEIGCGNGRFASLLFERVDWGIDLNPREIELCAGRNGLYGRLSQMDARRLIFADGVFGTVFANCVVEHIPNLDRVLAECRRVLRPGGAFIATVPLIEMNRHLLLRGAWYARLRAKQLRHLNLLAEDAWVAALSKAGFSTVRTMPYLSARMCRLWDRVDGPLCVGAGPLTLGRAYRLGMRLLPTPLRSKLNRQWQHYFMTALQENPSQSPCAMLIQARVASAPDASPPPPAT